MASPMHAPGVTAKPKLYPLSLAQERATLGRDAVRLTGREPVPSILWLCLEIRGTLDTDCLQAAIRAVVQQHPPLRAQISVNPVYRQQEREQLLAHYLRTGIPSSGLYRLRIGEATDVPLRIKEAVGDLNGEVRNVLQSDLGVPFDDGALLRLRATLVRQDERTHVLVLTIDHRVSDGRSLTILQRHVQQWYAHYACGATAPDPPRMHHIEFAEQEQASCLSAGFQEDLDYWEDHWRQFSGARLRPMDLPFADLTARPTDVFATQRLSVSESDTFAIRNAAKCAGVSPFIVLLSAWLAVLWLYTRRERLALWSHCANRNPQTLNSIGFYIHTHLMGFVVPEDCTCGQLMSQVAERLAETRKHERMPLPLLWQTLRCSPRFPDAGIMLDYLVDEVLPENAGPQVTFRKWPIEVPLPAKIARLSVVATNHGKTFSFRSDHIVPFFPEAAVKTMLEDLLAVATAMSTGHGRLLSSFAEVRDRYAAVPAFPGSEMEEFVVSGSALIPSQKTLRHSTQEH